MVRMPVKPLVATFVVLAAAGATSGLASPVVAAPPAGAVEDDADARLARRRTPVVEVFEASRDAVVNIAAETTVEVRSRSPFDSFFEELFDMPSRPPRRVTRQSAGSGFIIHPDGYIVTNAHVIARTTEQSAIFANGQEYEARIVAADPERDLAILKIDAGVPLPTLPLGRSDDLMPGETVVAIGNPLGFQHTVTAGVVSALDRSIEIRGDLAFEGLVQTDASINPGNSGGPLLNVHGELIGVNTAIRGDAQNIGFAIPVDQLRAVLPKLLDVERRYRVVTGLQLDALNGPRVVVVEPDSPADRSGVRTGDRLLTVDGRPVREGVDLDIALINRNPGEVLRLALDRGGERVDTSLRLAERPPPDAVALAAARLGIAVSPLSREMARDFGLRDTGLLVTRVERGGPADVAGLQRGDVLIALDRRYVSSLDEVGFLLEGVEGGKRLDVDVLRVERRGLFKLHGSVFAR